MKVISLKKILIVEDDDSIHKLIKELLIDKYEILDAYSGTEAMILLNQNNVNLILLDLMLPGVDGDEIISKFKSIPIIVISAKISPKDKVNSLLNGANDYITKPFNNDELLARIEVQLRNNTTNHQELEFKELKLLNDNRTLFVKNNKVSLTKTEYAILKQLLINNQEIIPKSKLLELISIDTLDCDENSLKVHISNIKKKIRKYSNNTYIESVWGIGYKMSDKS